MKYSCNEIGLFIEISDELVKRLCALASEHYPVEYGGLFVGRYVDRNKIVIVEETVLPKKFESTAVSFERDVMGLKKTLLKFFNKKPSLFYVGEWHTHPNGKPTPSSTDVSALKKIANHSEVLIKNPILLIIGIEEEVYNLEFYVLFKDKVLKYEKYIEELMN